MTSSRLPTTVFIQPRTFQQLVDDALALARRGASDAGVEVSEGAAVGVGAQGRIENVERTATSRWVFGLQGQRRGKRAPRFFACGAGADGARRLRHRPLHGGRPGRGLPDESDLARAFRSRDLDLFHPWAINADRRRDRPPLRGAALGSTGITIRRRGVSAQQSHFFAGNSRGFRGGYASSRHPCRWRPRLAARARRRRHAARRLVQLHALTDELAAPEALGRYALSARCRG